METSAQADRAARDIWSINHVGVATRDMAAIAARFEAMGFLLTPFSAHLGSWQRGGAVHSLGTGNRCIMFADSFVEILASANPAEPAQRITDFLAHHQGAHIICFGSRDMKAVDLRLKGAGIPSSGILPLQREVETPDGKRTMQVARLRFAPEATPEGFIQVAQHFNPEVVHQPRYSKHANGCYQLSEVTLVTDEVARMSKAYAGYLGYEPDADAGFARFNFTNSASLKIIHYSRASRELPGSLLPPIPGIAAMAFRTADLGGVRARLRGAKVPFAEAGERIAVPAEEACGVGLFFDGR